MPENNSDPFGILRALFIRHQTIYHDLAGRRFQNTCHHLDGRGLAGAIRPQVSDDLTFFDFQRNIFHGRDRLVVTGEKITDAALQPFVTVQDLKVLTYILHCDCVFHFCVSLLVST